MQRVQSTALRIPGALEGWDGYGVRGRFKKKGTYVYLWLIHVALWQKPTQHCKAIIFQLKKKKRSAQLDNIVSCSTETEVAQSCPTLCDPMDCSLPGSSAHGIFQTRVLEWAAVSFTGTREMMSKWGFPKKNLMWERIWIWCKKMEHAAKERKEDEKAGRKSSLEHGDTWGERKNWN